jgi:probable HAF family extracellular repeat protein
MTRHLLPATVVAAALLMPQHSMSAAKPGSTFVDLGTLGGGFNGAFGINNDPNSVQVVGRSRRADDFVHAFFWRSPGPMVDLGTFGGGNSYAADINDHGQGSPAAARTHPGGSGRRSGSSPAAPGPLRTSAPPSARAAPMRRGSTTDSPAIRLALPSSAAAPSAPARPTPPCGPGRQADGPCRPSARFRVTCPARRRTSTTAERSSDRAGVVSASAAGSCGPRQPECHGCQASAAPRPTPLP